jgi:CheY-like chemotaxis protein
VTRKTSADGQELVLIACKDEGAGLSRDNLKLLFGEGVQFNANKLQAGGGSGFGLFITKGIVLLHKGANIWANSEGEGCGCTFFVELPLVHVNMPSVPSVAELHDASVSVGPFANKKILIVDDSAMNRRILTHMLDAVGFECVQAADGVEAVAYVKLAGLYRSKVGEAVVGETPRGYELPDVILMDSNMPKMNGPDAVEEIRKFGYTQPIFGVTGDEDHAAFMRAGADGVMMKPVKGDALLVMIHMALKKEKASRLAN